MLPPANAAQALVPGALERLKIPQQAGGGSGGWGWAAAAVGPAAHRSGGAESNRMGRGHPPPAPRGNHGNRCHEPGEPDSLPRSCLGAAWSSSRVPAEAASTIPLKPHTETSQFCHQRPCPCPAAGTAHPPSGPAPRQPEFRPRTLEASSLLLFTETLSSFQDRLSHKKIYFFFQPKFTKASYRVLYKKEPW